MEKSKMYLRDRFVSKSTRSLLFLMPALALATPAFAWDTPSNGLADPSTPGSVIVFPKYVKGTVSVDGAPAEKTEIEVGVVCPKGATCAEHQPVKLRFHWVCPATQDFNTKFICKENDFDVFTSVNGKVVFDPDGMTITGSAPVTVPAAPCQKGYLIGWVINPANDGPTKFDGLMGDAVIRASGTAVQAYRAITIQADPNLPVSGDPTKVAITTGTDRLTGTPTLVFDGGAGHYQMISGAISGDVRYSNPDGPTTFTNTWLILMTLDVRSNQSNFPTEVGLDFYNETERLVSTSTEFVCWAEVELSTIDPNLTQAGMGTRKGLFVSTQAEKFPYTGIYDQQGPVTLLGLVQTNEGVAPWTADRSYIFQAFDNATPVATTFVPFP
jgi:hypothetical protein